MTRWNLIDAALVAVLGSVAAIGVAGYRRFQVPAPVIASVTPVRVAAGAAQPLALHGRYLQPFLHVFVSAAGEALPVDAVEPSRREAKTTQATATQLDVTLPPLTPGVYDLYLFDEFQQVAMVPRALVVEEPAYPRAEMTATLRFALDAARAVPVAVGDRDVAPPRDPRAPRTDDATVAAVRVDPAEHLTHEMWVASTGPGEQVVWMGRGDRRQQVDVELRVPLVQTGPDEWRYKGARVRAGELLDFESARFKGRGMVIWISDARPLDAAGPRR